MIQAFRDPVPARPPEGDIHVLEAWRVVSESVNDGVKWYNCDDELADPDAKALLVLRDCGGNQWLCYYDDHYFTVAKAHLTAVNGDQYMDVGYFYAPYVPMARTPIVLNPTSFNVGKGILTRYGRKLLEAARGTEGN